MTQFDTSCNTYINTHENIVYTQRCIPEVVSGLLKKLSDIINCMTCIRRLSVYNGTATKKQFIHVVNSIVELKKTLKGPVYISDDLFQVRDNAIMVAGEIYNILHMTNVNKTGDNVSEIINESGILYLNNVYADVIHYVKKIRNSIEMLMNVIDVFVYDDNKHTGAKKYIRVMCVEATMIKTTEGLMCESGDLYNICQGIIQTIGELNVLLSTR